MKKQNHQWKGGETFIKTDFRFHIVLLPESKSKQLSKLKIVKKKCHWRDASRKDLYSVNRGREDNFLPKELI